MIYKIVIGLFSVLLLVFLRPVAEQISNGLECIRVPRHNVALENIAFKSRRRTVAALLLGIAPIMIWSSLSLRLFGFSSDLEPDFASPLLALSLYVAARSLACFLMPPGGERTTLVAAMRSTWTMSMYYSLLCGVVWLLLSPLPADNSTLIIINTVLLGIFYIFNLWLETQILRTFYSQIKVFLYLCGLEFLPVSLVMGAVILL